MEIGKTSVNSISWYATLLEMAKSVVPKFSWKSFVRLIWALSFRVEKRGEECVCTSWLWIGDGEGRRGILNAFELCGLNIFPFRGLKGEIEKRKWWRTFQSMTHHACIPSEVTPFRRLSLGQVTHCSRYRNRIELILDELRSTAILKEYISKINSIKVHLFLRTV